MMGHKGERWYETPLKTKLRHLYGFGPRLTRWTKRHWSRRIRKEARRSLKREVLKEPKEG